ncbi:hypothetical protein L596_003524 [Steinernema carpocapsae]|uniref:Uncharacterized protein n=1 Tax=Steinernema carpocapsae TaxID=34508 RepID=A0A4U8UTW4_STECR|nr:hypothetical protein L596_003524 [Steinernema carpocapsae]
MTFVPTLLERNKQVMNIENEAAIALAFYRLNLPHYAAHQEAKHSVYIAGVDAVPTSSEEWASEMFLRRFWNEWNLVHEESTKGTLPGSRKVTVQSPSFTSDYTASASDELRFHGKHSLELQ